MGDHGLNAEARCGRSVCPSSTICSSRTWPAACEANDRWSFLCVIAPLRLPSWTHVTAGGGGFLNPVEFLGILGILAAWALVSAHHEGWAFTAMTITIAIVIITLFVDLYPRVMVSSTNHAFSLTAHNSASPPYSLKVTTVATLVLLPIVVAYQAWTYLRLPPTHHRPELPASRR